MQSTPAKSAERAAVAFPMLSPLDVRFPPTADIPADAFERPLLAGVGPPASEPNGMKAEVPAGHGALRCTAISAALGAAPD